MKTKTKRYAISCEWVHIIQIWFEKEIDSNHLPLRRAWMLPENWYWFFEEWVHEEENSYATTTTSAPPKPYEWV